MRANRYVSYLAAEIEPAALNNMRTFDQAVERTMQKIASAGGRGSAGFASSAMGNAIKRNTDLMATGATKAGRAIDVLDVAQAKAGRGARAMSASFSRAADALQIVQGPLGPLAGRLSALGQVLRSLTGFTLAGVLAGGGAFALGGIATGYQKVHDTLVPLFDEQAKLNGAMSDVVGIAGRTHQALQPIADLYAQITRVAKDAGISQKRAVRLTETISKASKIGGGSPEAQQAAIVQFGQALGANFRGAGQELQSILEQAPVLAQAIAHGLGVRTSDLKQLAQDQQLSTDLVIRALERSAAEVDARFASLPPRIGKSLTDLTNKLSVFVGHMDETMGATTNVATAISFLADHLAILTVAAGTAAAAFAAESFAAGAKRIEAWVSKVTLAQAEYNKLVNLQRAGEAVILGGARAAEMRASFVQQAATAELAAATAAQRGAVAYKAQLDAQLVLLEKQIAAQVRQLELARTLDAANRAMGGPGRSDLVKAATQDLNASRRALVLTTEQLIATEAELAAIDGRLVAATQALVVAQEELIAAEEAAIIATSRLGQAKAVLAGAMAKAQSAANSLVGFLGGPWGVAFTAAAGAAFTLSSMTEAAKDASERFAGGQPELRRQLGLTIDQLRSASAEARNLAISLAKADVVKAKSALHAGGRDLASSLYAARFQLPVGGKDEQTLLKIADGLRQGQRVTDAGQRAILDIYSRNERLQQGTAFGSIAGLLGADPRDAEKKIMGVRQAYTELGEAQKDLIDVQRELSKTPQPLIAAGGGKGPKKGDLNRQAAIDAATDGLARARAELAAAKAKGPLEGETNDAYVQRIVGLIQNVNNLVAAHKAAAHAKAEERHQQALLNKEMAAQERGRDNAAKLAGIQDQFSEDTPIKRLDRLRDAADKAKRAIQDLVGERVGERGIYTQGAADQAKAQIDAYEKAQERRPITDALAQAEQELKVQSLIAQGLGNQAEFVRQKYELEKLNGPLLADEEQQIRDNIARQNELNDALDKRSMIIENNARMLDGFRDSTKELIASLLQGDVKGGFKNFFHGIYQAFAEAKANELVMKLIGDPGKKYRDDMTRGLNDSADKLTGSAGDLSTSSSKLDEAAAALQNAAAAQTGAGAGDPLSAIGSSAGSIFGGAGGASDFAGLLTDGMDPAVAALYDLQGPMQDAATATQDAADAIVIVGKRLPTGKGPGSITSMLDQFGGKIGGQIAGPGSVLSKVMGKLGTALEGAGYGAAASGAFGGLTGVKQSNTGAMIGGALGGVAGAFIGGPIGAKIGSVLGGVLGGTVGGFFKKSPKGSATITSLDTATYSGSGQYKDAALGAAGDVQSGLKRIIDALGGTLGQFRVSIGQSGGNYHVDPTGTGNMRLSRGAISFGQDQQAATRFAILNAIQDGAVQGITAGAQRLLRAGQDLDAALEKAVKFQDVFKRLKKLKDPVGAAVDDLNTEFQNLIGIFKEAGASASEWGQLQELYDLERADAIKQATDQTVQLLDEYIKNLKGGPDSPLSNRTVYTNAKSEVDKFRSDIGAGKAVDQDALIKALDNFEQASSELYGSRSQFYTDFADILALAEKARSNAETGTGTGGALPASPFDGLTPIAQQQLTEQQTTNAHLGRIADLLHVQGWRDGPGASSIDALPFYSGTGGGGSSAATGSRPTRQAV